MHRSFSFSVLPVCISDYMNMACSYLLSSLWPHDGVSVVLSSKAWDSLISIFIPRWVLFCYITNIIHKTLLNIASISLGSVFPCERYYFAFRHLLFFMDVHLYGLQEIKHFFSALSVVWTVLSRLYWLCCEEYIPLCLCDDTNFFTVCLAGRFESWLTVKFGPSPSKQVASCKHPGLAANVKHSKKSRK